MINPEKVIEPTITRENVEMQCHFCKNSSINLPLVWCRKDGTPLFAYICPKCDQVQLIYEAKSKNFVSVELERAF